MAPKNDAVTPEWKTSQQRQGTDTNQVELRAQSNENSQLFLESQSLGQQQNMSRFTNHNELFQGTQLFQHKEAAKITVNLEDAVLQEQKLFSILEVRPLLT